MTFYIINPVFFIAFPSPSNSIYLRLCPNSGIEPFTLGWLCPSGKWVVHMLMMLIGLSNGNGVGEGTM